MDIAGVLNSFRKGSGYTVYGGNEKILQLLEKFGPIIRWYTGKFVPKKYERVACPYTKLISDLSKPDVTDIDFDSFSKSIFFIVGNGAVSGRRAELFADNLFRKIWYQTKIIIFLGYKDFVLNEGENMVRSFSKTVFQNGCVIIPENDRLNSLRRVFRLIDPNFHLQEPLPDENRPEDFSKLMSALPYTHCIKRMEESEKETGKIIYPVEESGPTRILDLDSNPPRIKFGEDFNRSTIHWGQRKLLMAEIELLTEVISQFGSDRKYLVVYIGSAPGNHISYLADLFSKFDFEYHLWDRPSRFNIENPEEHNIKIVPQKFEDPSLEKEFEGFFTDYVVDQYVKEYGIDNNIIFVSDIRDSPEDEDVIRDMTFQMNWVKKLNPLASHLKFRFPFVYDSPTYPYLDGKIFTQVWAPKLSSETRLYSTRPYTMKEYPHNVYDEAMAYFNKYTRMGSYHIGNIVEENYGDSLGIGRSIPMLDQGLCTCHDCSREVGIISRYFNIMEYQIQEEQIKEFVRMNSMKSTPQKEKKALRTLWSQVRSRKQVNIRKNIILGKAIVPVDGYIYVDTGLINMDVSLVGNIIINADMLSSKELVEMGKKESPYVWTKDTKIDTFKKAVQKERIPYIINFHTNFVTGYESARDTGKVGVRVFSRLALESKISGNTIEEQCLLRLVWKAGVI